MNFGLTGKTALICGASKGLGLACGRQQAIPAARFGTPDEFAAVCAFLCSRQAAYMTAQNVLVDGGAYPGTF